MCSSYVVTIYHCNRPYNGVWKSYFVQEGFLDQPSLVERLYMFALLQIHLINKENSALACGNLCFQRERMKWKMQESITAGVRQGRGRWEIFYLCTRQYFYNAGKSAVQTTVTAFLVGYIVVLIFRLYTLFLSLADNRLNNSRFLCR